MNRRRLKRQVRHHLLALGLRKGTAYCGGKRNMVWMYFYELAQKGKL